MTADNMSDATIAAALNREIPVIIMLSENASTLISEAALHAIKESGTVVQARLPNGMLLTIDGASITNNAVALDLYIEIERARSSMTIDGVEFSKNAYIITPAAHGEFGFTISFDISAQQLRYAGITGEQIRLYHISRGDVVTDLGPVELNWDGSVTITISHASRYILADDTPIAEIPPVIDDTQVTQPEPELEPVAPPVPPVDITPPTLSELIRNSIFGNNVFLWILIGCGVLLTIGVPAIILIRRRLSYA